MGVNYESYVFLGVEISEEQNEKIWQDDLDVPDGVREMTTGNGVSGDDIRCWLSVSVQQEEWGLASELRMKENSIERQSLIEFAESLGVENADPKWMLGGYVG